MSAIYHRVHVVCIFVYILLIGLFLVSYTSAENYAYLEIHCKHFFYGYPAGTFSNNDLIIRDIYALSSNDETKLSDWVAYRLDPNTIEGNVKTKRNWKTDPCLSEEETLEPDDYKEA